MIDKLENLSRSCLDVCNKLGWKRNWVEVGCYLHLESSEYIEALRGKGNSSSEEEAGDILFVLLSSMSFNNVSVEKTIEILEEKIRRLSNGK